MNLLKFVQVKFGLETYNKYKSYEYNKSLRISGTPLVEVVIIIIIVVEVAVVVVVVVMVVVVAAETVVKAQ